MSESLKAFIQYFNNEYPNFGGKPILERYKAEFDAFDNEFIDSRYYAFQSAWQHQQAKVDELQKRVNKALTKLDKKRDELWSKWKENADVQDQGAANAFEEAYWILEQVLNGENNE